MRRESEAQRAVFERLYCDTRADLLAYIVRRSSSPEDAADVLAEIYLIAWQKLDAIPMGEQARPWLFGVARNLLLRGSTRYHAANALVERLSREIRNVHPVHWPVEDRRYEALRAALKALPEVDREIMTLTAWEGLTPKQIARVMDMSANTVRVRLHRARSRLQRQLSPPDKPAAGPSAFRLSEQQSR